MSESTDDELEDMVRQLIGRRPAPEGQAIYAIEVFSLPRLSEELAQLVYDSTSPDALVGVRSGDSEGILLTFVQNDLTLHVERESAESLVLTGQVDAPTTPELVMHRIDGSHLIPVAENGEFVIESRGAIRFSCQAGQGHLETDWFRI